LPILPRGDRIRDLPYIKIFLIALFWTLITAYIPLTFADINANFKDLFYLAERFLFILFITIPFDIRDKSDDQSVGLKTVVTAIGIRRIKSMGMIIGIAGILSLFALFAYQHIPLQYFLSILICYLLATFLFLRSGPKISSDYYSVLIDGLMILRYIFLYFVLT
jgi:4-hydroxybenzoate polyprenyltransferase